MTFIYSMYVYALRCLVCFHMKILGHVWRGKQIVPRYVLQYNSRGIRPQRNETGGL